MNGSRMRSKRNQKVSGNEWKWTPNNLKLTGHSKDSPQREVHSDTDLPKKDRNISINNLTLHLQELEEQQQRQPRASRKKKITKIRAQFSDIETKSTILRINKSRSRFFEKINNINKPLSRLIQGKKREREPK